METPAPKWERHYPERTLGRRVLGYEEVSTTMDVVWDLCDQGAVNGTAIVAQSQTRGRGRFGRRWISKPGDALLVSVLLRSPESDIGPLLPVQATLAVHGAVRDLSGIDCSIKWPNDIQIGGRKLCGILVEVRSNTDGGRTAVVGVGLNLNLDPAAHDPLKDTATSILRETGVTVGSDAAAEALFARLAEEMTRSAEDSVGRWKQRLDTLGTRVTVYQRGSPITGVAEDVSPTGSLMVKSDDGILWELPEGDVSLAGPFP